MKHKTGVFGAALFATAFLAVFVVGTLWSLFPFGGATLPHWVELWSGVSFQWSALLVSSLLGLVCVVSISLFAFTHALTTEAELEW